MSCSFKELCALSVRGNEAKLFKNTLLQSIDFFLVWGQKGGLFVVSLRKYKQELKCLSSGYGFSRPLLLIRGGGALVAIKEVRVENYS